MTEWSLGGSGVRGSGGWEAVEIERQWSLGGSGVCYGVVPRLYTWNW